MFKKHNAVDYKAECSRLEEEIYNLKKENAMLKSELADIKPIIEEADLKPAVSLQCKNCKYCISSRWDGNILGCCKGLVCDDFENNDEE